MKSTDLMLGDWVMFNNPLKVQHIYNNGYDDIVAEIMEEGINDKGEYEEIRYVPSTYCSPIPLTPEILKKNGFVQDDAYTDAIADGCFAEFLVWHYYANEVIVSYDNSEELVISNNVGYPCSEITLYRPKVHELQHALRLCRLDELADNFKV